jgi:hypothetical protein
MPPARVEIGAQEEVVKFLRRGPSKAGTSGSMAEIAREIKLEAVFGGSQRVPACVAVHPKPGVEGEAVVPSGESSQWNRLSPPRVFC